MKRALVFLQIVTIMGFVGCNKNNHNPVLVPKPIELTAKSIQVIEHSNGFGINLFSRVALDDNRNLMLSPLSASTALTMLLNGCGGDTYDQLKSTLDYPSELSIAEINEAYNSLVSQLLKADPKVKLSLANAIFYRSGLNVKAPFISTLEREFSAQVKQIDFSSPTAVSTINKWASDNTNGLITKVIDNISPDVAMFLLNALYFKGSWSNMFEKSSTQFRPFYLANGTSVEVPTMMGEVDARVAYGEHWSALELPYGRTNFTMVIVMPNETLPELYAELSGELWNNITSSIDAYSAFSETMVYLPKFKFSYEQMLNDYLISMGMVDAFDELKANLSEMSDSQLYVDFVKQNTFVEVNEEGTEAAAVTTVGMSNDGAPMPRRFIVDKPFVFAIRERTSNTLMFIGQVVNPK